ncbi:RNA polymerase sigma factor [Niastella populi]|uniref:RNA polymerase subunit sigma-70 n=1 Tax=Niastella populi TaxID=550983 RepID=A0A1V9F2L9_9BACT|nr:sigma-70 family RNA polymerase sigma factor [Niastella populi]OQP52495.1 RNA polymerase subunit sigma-70 [Niastella populi]
MDQSQFLALIAEHQGIILKICRIYRNTKEDRDDLFQEIVFQLWKSAPSFEGRAKFSTWMYRIALSTAIATYRKKKPAIHYTAVLPYAQEEQVDNGEQRERLYEALARLNDADKALITLYLEDLSYQEIAAITGLSENNVGVKLNRIKNKIQQLLNIKK